MASKHREVEYHSLEIPLQYGTEDPINFPIGKHLLTQTVAKVKRELLALNALRFVREAEEYLDLVIVFGRGKGKDSHDQEIVLRDSDLLGQYYDELCAGHLMLLRVRRRTFYNDLTYYKRRTHEVFSQHKTTVTGLCLVTTIVFCAWVLQ